MPLPTRDWFWVACIWSGLALFNATQSVLTMQAEGMHHAWASLFVFRILCWLVWALATPLIWWIAARFPPRRSWRSWCVHGATGIAIGVVSALWTATLETLMDPFLATTPATWAALWSTHFLGGLVSDLIVYGTVLAVGFGLHSRERLVRQQAESARLNEQLVKAQLDALRRQIEPHFLFNTLNAVTGLVRDGRHDAAVGMITGLSDLLRRVLDDGHRHLVPLSEELAYLDTYLALQKVRFGDRLQFSVSLHDDLMAAKVPGLILQPLVENAFQHGLARRAAGGAIRVDISATNGVLTLALYNDGPGLPAAAAGGRSGIGLANVRERLKSLYGDQFTLAMRNQGCGVLVTMTIPYVEYLNT
jgi:signal transduction histidine kinase